jgi:quercetin dioxygenase-like cupin family protein
VKRHPALVPLSHDHHHGLVEAKRLRARAEGADSRAAALAFLGFFERETVAHFREEEERLFPLVVDSDDVSDSLTRALIEHQRIHALAGRLGAQVGSGAPDPELMVELGDTLEAHIRFEERELFPLIERAVSDLHLLRAPGAVAGRGPVWGVESEELNATVLEWDPGHRVAEHVNDERDVLVVVLAGSAEIAVAGRRQRLRSGQALIIPKGEPRQITAGGEGVRYLSAHRRRPPLQIAPAPLERSGAVIPEERGRSG